MSTEELGSLLIYSSCATGISSILLGWRPGLAYPARCVLGIIQAVLGALANLAWGIWPLVAFFGVSALVIAYLLFRWWRRNRKKRRASLALGAKALALRASLVRKMRESARPRPVLRPVPGGAR